MGLPPYPFQLIRWIDSASEDGWRSMRRMEDPRTVPCMTVGWVVAESDEALTVFGTWAPETESTTEQVCSGMTIPKAAILSRTVVRLPKAVTTSKKRR